MKQLPRAARTIRALAPARHPDSQMAAPGGLSPAETAG